MEGKAENISRRKKKERDLFQQSGTEESDVNRPAVAFSASPRRDEQRVFENGESPKGRVYLPSQAIKTPTKSERNVVLSLV